MVVFGTDLAFAQEWAKRTDGIERPTFEDHIRPLFRTWDVREMDFLFDLDDYGAVRHNSTVILQRLNDGDMPHDGWPDYWIKLFERWIAEGHPER